MFDCRYRPLFFFFFNLMTLLISGQTDQSKIEYLILFKLFPDFFIKQLSKSMKIK